MQGFIAAANMNSNRNCYFRYFRAQAHLRSRIGESFPSRSRHCNAQIRKQKKEGRPLFPFRFVLRKHRGTVTLYCHTFAICMGLHGPVWSRNTRCAEVPKGSIRLDTVGVAGSNPASRTICRFTVTARNSCPGLLFDCPIRPLSELRPHSQSGSARFGRKSWRRFHRLAHHA
jgi:hypothetical protein